MSLYRRDVREIIEKDMTEAFLNDSTEHAKVLIEEFIRSAKESVYIACNNFSKDVYDDEDICNAIDWALLRGVKFHVGTLCGCDDSECCKLFEERKIDVKKLTGNKEINFIVIDGKRLRYETDVKTRSALCYGNNPEQSAKLEARWQRMTG